MKFKEFLDKAIEDFLKKEQGEREIGKYHASELWGCLRRNWFFYKKPKEIPLRTLKIFEAGTLVHRFFRDVLFKTYVTNNILKKFDYEGELKYEGDGFTVIGKYDDFIVFEEDNKPAVIEIKTVRDLRYFEGKPKPHHEMQLQFYLNMLNADQGYIVYVDRGNLNHLVYEVKRDQEKFKVLVKRAEILHDFITKDKVPPPEAKINKELSFSCSYCPYRKECEEVGR